MPRSARNSEKPKGKPRGGSRKGIPNKATVKAREAIAIFIDGNAHKLQKWLDQVAEEHGPKEAAKLFVELLEYHVPKLARTEIANADDKPFVVDATMSPAEAYARAIKP